MIILLLRGKYLIIYTRVFFFFFELILIIIFLLLLNLYIALLPIRIISNLLHVVFQVLPLNYKVKFLVSLLIRILILLVDLVVLLNFMQVLLSIIHLPQVIYQCHHSLVNHLYQKNLVPYQSTTCSRFQKICQAFNPVRIIILHLHLVALLMMKSFPWMNLNHQKVLIIIPKRLL